MPRVLRIVLLLGLLSAVRARSLPDEDDEIIIVEDVTDEEEPRFDPKTEPKTNRPKKDPKKSRNHGEGYKPSEEVFKSAVRSLKRFKRIVDGFDVYHDGEAVAKVAADIDEEIADFKYHWASINSKYNADPATHRAVYDLGNKADQLLTHCMSKFQAQMTNHESILASTASIIPNTPKYKTLAKYIASRLKANRDKSVVRLSKKMSSKENIKEMLELQAQLRAGRIIGLSSRELTSFVTFAVLPVFVVLVIRILVLQYAQMIEATSILFDCIFGGVPPLLSAAFHVLQAGYGFLSVTNLVVIYLFALSLSLFCPWCSVALLRMYVKRRYRKAPRGVRKRQNLVREAQSQKGAQENQFDKTTKSE